MSWQTILAQGAGGQSEQQDCGGAWRSRDERMVLVVLADGAGGHDGGEQASRTAVETARALWNSDPPAMCGARSFLEKLSRAAHDAVAGLPYSPRTTWLALVLDETEAAWAHSGDTRLYHFVAGRLALRTVDHSLVQILIEKGKARRADAGTHPDRSVLLQSLGGPEYLSVEHGTARAGREDVFIMCTDGVWAALDDAHLLNLARCAPDNRRRAADEIVAGAAKSAGAKADNASLWIVGRQ